MDKAETITAGRLAELLGVTPKTICDLAKRDLLVKGNKRGTYLLSSVARYCAHVRTVASGRGSAAVAEARVKLAEGQADLASARAARLRGETVSVAEVEALWRKELLAFRARLLAIPARMHYLDARQNVTLTRELRDVLTGLAR